MLKRVFRKKLVLAGALAFSVSLLAPIGAKADNCYYCDVWCEDDEYEYSENIDFTWQDMGISEWEEYYSDIETDISITNSGEDIKVSGLVRALSKNDQFLMFNEVYNYGTKNRATVGGEVLKNAKGNIGANVVAGDYNAQSNIVAIAVGEEETSLVESKTFSLQKAKFNWVDNEGVTNTASADNEVLKNAKGNIGLNIAAGSNNAQTNQLGIAVGPARVGVAVAYVQQKSKYNMVGNLPIQEEEVIWNEVSLNLNANGWTLGGYTSGIYGGYTYGGFTESGTISGTSEGMSYQASNFYPDTWKVNPEYEPHNQHPHSPKQIGHFDMDAETQGAIANPNRPGVGGLAFDNRNTINANYEGGGYYRGGEYGGFFGWIGAQQITLSGTITGSIPVVIVRNIDTVNTASLSGQVLMNAAGNIGVNVAAGTNNLQANALSVTYIPEGESVPVPPISPEL